MNTLEVAKFFVSVVTQIGSYLEDNRDNRVPSVGTDDVQTEPDDIAHLLEIAKKGEIFCCSEFFTRNSPDNAFRRATYSYEVAETLFRFALLEGLHCKNMKLMNQKIVIILAKCAVCENSYTFIHQLRLPYIHQQDFFKDVLRLAFFLAKESQKISAPTDGDYL